MIEILPQRISLAAQKVARSRKLEALEARRRAFLEEAEALHRKLLSGHIGPLIWNVELRDLLQGLHISAYAIGRSGEWSAITPSDWGRHVSSTLRRQYRFLREWATSLGDLSQLTVEGLQRRTKLYAAAARQSFERGLVTEVGIDPSVLPAFPGDGTTECRTNDRCRWAIRILSKARGDFDASWRFGRAEHCRTCRARARAWKKLRIRGGILLDPVDQEGVFAQ